MTATDRIIPARAGFTWPPPRWWRAAGDHPRSRGVYMIVDRLTEDRVGIIPARAGFTLSVQDTGQPVKDHPRSRGVYGSP